MEVLDNVETIVANSEYTKNLAISLGVQQDKIVVINPGVDPVEDLDKNN